eukprot:Plantae.Rhodophyta-Purpureofilum_apyrenoidigerum.ctg7476.p1 GENE.Plantae.Rhodophyta-Purpureofilum_apyrenoidigerum.ctg7476~~Plantae.Rhodophyta-Purpureofilum_apyrenoidigerum.ctg7476.p1  ORF type:complete len:224 (-),score=54.54 Plantae.Rhodophyta-Purpureofilum_apyrenoidigerum.ctg7476:362-1033(-)
MFALRGRSALRTLQFNGSTAGRSGLWAMMSSEARQDDQKQSRVAHKYALALFNAAESAKSLPDVKKDVKMLLQLNSESDPFHEFLMNPVISRTFKKAVLTDTIAKKVGLSDTTTKFLGVLAENGRTNELGIVLSQFQRDYLAGDEAAKGVITVAEPLTTWQRANLERRLAKMFFPNSPEQSLNVEYRLDPSLIGGVTASINDRFVDMSVKREAAQIEELVRSA